MSDVTMNKPDEEMATDVTTAQTTTTDTNPGSSPVGKGKGKAKQVEDDSMEVEDEEDEDEDEEEEEEEDDDDDDDEDLSEINPEAIIPSGGGRPRRNRPVIDYSSQEAMAKAGVDPAKVNDDD
ncbi:syndecan domain-containing protein [Ceratobasidium sp. AG-Ba]|nr:syndecan domain-containing protein [Ceratobasidium sp. AG-Ba]